jgi:hypothetical protein
MNMDRNTVSVPMTGGVYAATALASAMDDEEACAERVAALLQVVRSESELAAGREC